MINIPKGTIFKVGDKKVMALNDIHISDTDKVYFIFNYWEQCVNKELALVPVDFAKCETIEELFVLRKDNILLGSERDVCLD